MGLSEKALFFYFSFAEYLAVRGTTSLERADQADFPRLAPLWWNLAVGFCQALSGYRRTPEGLGAWENPTGGFHSERASRESPPPLQMNCRSTSFPVTACIA